MKPADVIKLIKDKEVRYADLRFTDTRGKEQHVTIPANLVDEDLFRDGKMFDGSSIAGWKGINESDMILSLDPTTAVIDPFFEATTVNIRCDVIEPATMQGYERDPRSLGRRAEAYLKSTGIADGALFGPENEFFIFDSVRWNSSINESSYAIDSVQEQQYGSRGWQQGTSPGLEGRLLSRSASRCFPGHPLRHVRRARRDGPRGRGASPRSSHRRSVRNRRGTWRSRDEG
jgi:glutamine synthetase